MKKLLFAACLVLSTVYATDVTVSPIQDTTPTEIDTSAPQDLQYQKTLAKTVTLIVGGLGFVFVLMVAARRFTYIKYASGNQSSHIKVIERRPISPKTVLYLVQIGEQKVLIGESQLEVKRLLDLQK